MEDAGAAGRDSDSRHTEKQLSQWQAALWVAGLSSELRSSYWFSCSTKFSDCQSLRALGDWIYPSPYRLHPRGSWRPRLGIFQAPSPGISSGASHSTTVSANRSQRHAEAAQGQWLISEELLFTASLNANPAGFSPQKALPSSGPLGAPNKCVLDWTGSLLWTTSFLTRVKQPPVKKNCAVIWDS